MRLFRPLDSDLHAEPFKSRPSRHNRLTIRIHHSDLNQQSSQARNSGETHSVAASTVHTTILRARCGSIRAPPSGNVTPISLRKLPASWPIRRIGYSTDARRSCAIEVCSPTPGPMAQTTPLTSYADRGRCPVATVFRDIRKPDATQPASSGSETGPRNVGRSGVDGRYFTSTENWSKR